MAAEAALANRPTAEAAARCTKFCSSVRCAFRNQYVFPSLLFYLPRALSLPLYFSLFSIEVQYLTSEEWTTTHRTAMKSFSLPSSLPPVQPIQEQFIREIDLSIGSGDEG